MNTILTISLAVLLSAGLTVTLGLSGLFEHDARTMMVSNDVSVDESDIASLESDLRTLRAEITSKAPNDDYASSREVLELQNEVKKLRSEFDKRSLSSATSEEPGSATLNEADLESMIEEVQARKDEQERIERDLARTEQRAKQRSDFVVNIDKKIREWGSEHALTEVQIQEVVSIMTIRYDARSQMFSGMRNNNDGTGGGTLDRDAMQSQMEAISAEAEASLKSTLTADQYTAFAQVSDDLYRNASGMNVGGRYSRGNSDNGNRGEENRDTGDRRGGFGGRGNR